MRLRNRLIVAFLLATVLPVAASLWIAMSLLERSLAYATTGELDRLSRTLERTVRQFYQREREALRAEALAGQVRPVRYAADGAAAPAAWPEPVRDFWNSAETERFGLSGPAGDHVDYMRRSGEGVDVYTRDLGGMRLEELSAQFRETREIVGAMQPSELRRGFALTLVLLVAAVWVASLAPLVFMAHRISRPIQQLTAGLTGFAAGDWDLRLDTRRNDEVGRAVQAFNDMAEQLREGRARLVYLTQMSSWQTIARKTAHELKNSLTPIRLTVEEMVARGPAGDRAFLEQAAQIVVSEIETLERRVRAFSELSSEPPVRPESLDINALVRERVALLAPAHPETAYEFALDAGAPVAHAPGDLVKGILTNLLENAAEAAGPGGHVLTTTRIDQGEVCVEVHDTGPGVPPDTVATLFEPTITFKKHGMGLGLSIARKNALLSGGDILLVPGTLGGAGFRVRLPAAPARA